MAERKTIAALVVGGEASAGPPLGPSLGPLGVNVMAVVKRINDLTKEYAGMRVPVKVHVDTESKQFEVEVGVPTASALIVKESGAMVKTKEGEEKPGGSGSPRTSFVGNLTLEQVLKIARAKRQQSYGRSLKSVAKEIVGSCVSMGITVEGTDARDFIKEIDSGKWDSTFSES